MIDEKLREILKEFSKESCKAFIFGKDKARAGRAKSKIISQIKSLVIESLGEEKPKRVINGVNVWIALDGGYNQHISEMKKKWK